MKKALVGLGVVAVIALVIWTLQTNKAKSEAAAPKETVVSEIAVNVTAVREGKLDQALSLTGSVEANRDVMLVSETSGRVVSMNVKIGDYLAAGAVVLQVDDELARASVMAAEAANEKAKSDLDRYNNLRSQNIGTETNLEALKLQVKTTEAQLIQARKALSNTRVRMPFAGRISSKMVDLGATLAPGTQIGNIVDINTLKIRVNVPEEDVVRLKLGDRARITSSVYPEQTFEGRIQAIGVKADGSHTYPVDVVMGNPARYPFKAGMFARVDFISLSGGNGLIVPRNALVGSSKSPQVYVVKNNVAQLRKIKIGREAGDQLGVTEGLEAGDVVVVGGQLNLYDNAKVNIVK